MTERGEQFQRSAWEMVAVREPLERVETALSSPGADEAVVQVAGCGVCHTDIGFWHEGIKTRKTPPLVLGHEISGTVVQGPSYWKGKSVIVPAVLPCGDCHLCRRGRGNICRKQKMPGNDFDGGFASYVIVPSRYLCEVPGDATRHYSLAELAVVADAVSTPYQAVKKSGLKEDDFCIVIGVGGIGIYGVQIAMAHGAKVVAVDIDPERLAAVEEAGVDRVLNVRDFSPKDARANLKEICGELGASSECWQIFEMSGTKQGQELAFILLGFAATLSVVGFTMEKVEVRLSNLMAFDASAIGTWGCNPELYPEVLDMIIQGKLQLKPFTETFPMSQINGVFTRMVNRRQRKRAVLIPDF